MRPLVVEVLTPGRELAVHFRHASEQLDVQALHPETAIEAFDEGIPHWLPWPDEGQLHLMEIRPGLHDLASKLGPVVDGDRRKLATLANG